MVQGLIRAQLLDEEPASDRFFLVAFDGGAINRTILGAAVRSGRVGVDVGATLVMLTALAEERAAVRALLHEPHTVRHPAGTRYDVAQIPGSEWQVALASVGEGNLAAAALTERSIAHFAPKAVMFVGIAGGLRSDLRLGDVVVAKRVYAFHGGRDEPGSFGTRPRCWDAPHALLQLAEAVAASQSWVDRLPEAFRSAPPTVHFAAVAAGEVVLNSETSVLVQFLRTHYNDTAAIETESAGFALAGHLNFATPALTIRGISDAAAGEKDVTDRQGWRLAAATNAAAFAFGLAIQLAAEAETDARGHGEAGTGDHPAVRPAHSQHIDVRSGGVAFIVQDGTQHVYPQPAPVDRRPKQNTRASRPYLLMETERLIGRGPLLTEISDFLRAGSTGQPVMVILGAAGIGKSALTWEAWRKLGEATDGRRMFWYSFYDGHGIGSFRTFLDELATFLGLAASEQSIASVLEAITFGEPILFLDGIERCLRCYQRPLPIGDLEAIRAQERLGWDQHDLAFATAESYEFFLRITQLSRCRVLCSSRVMPSDFQASGGAVRPGIKALPVGALNAEEAQALLDAVGLGTATDTAAAVSRSLGGHPLALQVLARQARRSVEARRDLDAWLAVGGYLHSDGSGAGEIRSMLFATAASQLSTLGRAVLTIVGAMGGAVDSVAIYDVLRKSSLPINENSFRVAVEEVVATTLGLETPGGEIACHPLAALAAGDQLLPTQMTQLVSAITAFATERFTSAAVYGGDNRAYYDWVRTGRTADRSEALALCHALVRLGAWEEAATLYYEELNVPIRYVLGANFEAVEVLQLIVDGLEASKSEDWARVMRGTQCRHLLMVLRPRKVEESFERLSGVYDVQDNIEFELHRGRVEVALGLACEALMEAENAIDERSQRFYDAVDRGTLSMFTDYNEWVSENASSLLTRVVWCARALLAADYLAEAASMLAGGLEVQRAIHHHCDGCLARLVGCAAEYFAAVGQFSLATQAVDAAKTLTEAEGRPLFVMLSDVMVTAACRQTQYDRGRADEFSRFLGERGFVLYQLIVESAALSPTAAGAFDELRKSGVPFMADRVRKAAAPPVSRELVNSCVRWAAWAGGPRRLNDRGRSNSDEEQRIFDAVDQALREGATRTGLQT